MKHISKNIWFALSIAIVGVSALYAFKKPVQKEKASHIVVDRLVNQLVCKFNMSSGGSRNYPRGFFGINLPQVAVKRDSNKHGGDEYTLCSSHKVVTGRQGMRRGDRWRPAGGDF